MLFARIQRMALAVMMAAFAQPLLAQTTTSSSSSSTTTSLPSSATSSPTSSSSSASTSSSTSSASPSPTQAQSVFVSPEGDLAFAINVPQDSTTDIIFAIAVPAGVSWGAVGLGQSGMQGALVLMVYASASSNNVTFSPRLAVGHHEPTYYPGLQLEVLNATMVNETFLYAARCSNCRNWPGGYIDVDNTGQKCIFATGPDGWVSSDDPAAPLKFHEEFGAFTINMKAATGPAGVPVIGPETSVSVGASVGTYQTDGRDWGAAFHAFCMVGCFAVLFPVGVLLLRRGNAVPWHYICQGIGLFGVIVGAGLGIFISFYYNRSRSFTNPHQIIGIVATFLVIVQFSIGFTNHRIAVRTLRPSRFRVPHIWLGRVVIVLGVVNGFLGFPFALNPKTDYLLGIVVIVMTILFGASIFWRGGVYRRNMPGGVSFGGRTRAQSAGYAPEPFRSAAAPPYSSQGEAPPYEAEEEGITGGSSIGLRDLERPGSPPEGGERTRSKDGGAARRTERDDASGVDLGAEQRPAEYV